MIGSAREAPAGMVRIEGGTFMMGSTEFYPEERPVHQVRVETFFIDLHPVTNDEFSKFVDETRYVTIAERKPDPKDYPGTREELLVPGALVFHRTAGPVDLRDWTQWWRYVPGASWRRPEGPGSSVNGHGDHPVVHVAYEDVESYARWAGKTLPTEAEWEFAARGGLEGARYVWGNEMRPGGKIMANTWQGNFPYENLLEDGYERTSPVGAFPPNGYGLYDMAGNVWEWTSDWFREHATEAGAQTSPCCSYDPGQPQIRIPRKVLKGGSHLCAPNYCLRFRPAARSPQMIDTGMSHLGFRCIIREAEIT